MKILAPILMGCVKPCQVREVIYYDENAFPVCPAGAPFKTWFDFNPSMDK